MANYSFFSEYFIQPLIRNGWFNPFNTVVYGVLLILGFLLVYKILLKLGIGIDKKLMLSLTPFIFLASSTRAIRDFVYQRALEHASFPLFYEDIAYNFSIVSQEAYNYVSSIANVPLLADISALMIGYFPTPFSYLITFFIAFSILLFSLLIQKYLKVKYWKSMFLGGMLLCIWNALIFPFKMLWPLFIVLLIFGIWSLSVFVPVFIMRLHPLKSYISKMTSAKRVFEIFNYENLGILSAHLLDASATYTAATFFGLLEQHFIPRFLFSVFGPMSFFILKIIVIVPILYILDNAEMEYGMKNLIKITIVIMGLAPGIRDTLTLLAS